MSIFHPASIDDRLVAQKRGPDALHVGFSKCASTFLQNFFFSHPDIFLVNQSHFFAPFYFSTFDSGPDSYFDLYDDAGDHQLKLESDEHILLPLFHPVLRAAATTLESIEEIALRIKNVRPDAKIILVVRNQISLMVSRYSEYILGGGRYDFEMFVDEFLSCSLDQENYYANYYTMIFETFTRQFSTEDVLVLLQEDLSRTEQQTIARLCDFLKIREHQPVKRGPIASRVGLSRLGLKVTRIFNTILVVEQEMSSKRAKARIPYLLYKILLRLIRITDYYLPIAIKGDKNSIVTFEIERRIRKEFEADNAALAKLLDRDLSKLGY